MNHCEVIRNIYYSELHFFFKLLSDPDNSFRLIRRFSLEGANKTLASFPVEVPSNRPSTPSITVLDVYDIAASIGKEFEAIIDKYGPYSVSNLMPKVISVLEELEDFATRFESEGREIITLQTAVHRLELEKLDRKEDQNRHKKELEQIEETWHSEVQELLQLIEKLKEENKQLKDAIEDKETSNCQSPAPSSSKVPTNIEEIQLMIRLKEIIDRQKIQIRSLRQQLAQKHVDLDAMQQQATRLAKLNAVLRRKHFVSKRQADQLRDEKITLETLLSTKEQEIKQIQEHVCHNNNNSDNSANENTVESPICPDMSQSLIAELISPETPPPQLTEEQLVERLNIEGKMIINKQDPNRPRFTFQELRNVLAERNELKSRLIEVEEELLVYKKAGNPNRPRVKRWDEAPPVEGPINREPDEKLYATPRSNLRVKRFFESLLSKLSR
ncbi:unnamed protein product [Heterobilharzia americana]|nr:unnamed protein product [Heterobilharzia americana]